MGKDPGRSTDPSAWRWMPRELGDRYVFVNVPAYQMQVMEGKRITEATQMVELYGCHACHKINNWRFENLQKPGPTLDHIAKKTTPDWAFRWIADPRGFKSTTRMPAFFYQRNMIGPHVPANEREQNIKYQDAEIHAIVTFLFANSTKRQWLGPNTGDAAHGKQVVESVGCLGCHLNSETITDKDGKVLDKNLRGPMLERRLAELFGS